MTATPEGWQSAPLGDVCQVVSGSTPKTGTADYWDGDINWVTPNDLSKDRSQVIQHGERSLTAAGYRSCSARLFPAGSVIVSSRAPIGYVAIAGTEMCTNQGCKTAIPPDFIDPKYLYWFLLKAKPDLESRASGTTFKEISGKRFAETKLWWPGYEEQRRIVEILEGDFSRLDAARNNVQAARLRAGALRASSLSSAWAESEGSAGRRPVRDIGPVVTGATPKNRTAHLAGELVPFVTPGDVEHGGHIRTAARSFPTDLYASGRVMRGPAVLAVCIGATIGKVGWMDRSVSMNQQINAVLVGENLAAFVAALMASPQFQSQMREHSSATTMPILNKRQFSSLELPLPTRGEQERLLERLNFVFDEADRNEATVATADAQTMRLRKALLEAAFAGKLTAGRTNSVVDKEMLRV